MLRNTYYFFFHSIYVLPRRPLMLNTVFFKSDFQVTLVSLEYIMCYKNILQNNL